MILYNSNIIFWDERDGDKLKILDLRNNKLVSVSKRSYKWNWGMIGTNIVIAD